MKLYEDSCLHLDASLGELLPAFNRKRFRKLSLREILAHQAGLKAWIPYYQVFTKKNGAFRSETLSDNSSDEFKTQIADSLWIHDDIKEKIVLEILKSKVDRKKQYRYSGLFFYLVPEIVEKCSGQTYEEYLADTFYRKMGLERLVFNPLESNISQQQIVPTEVDTFFRMEKIHGLVHDEGAILMNGVSGNAGLFSSATDLAKVCMMLLQNGNLNGTQYLKPETIEEFTRVQFLNNDNRRGLGFDKPLLQYDSLKSSVSKHSSPSSYGHTGYTGTLVWVDPKFDLIYIFLSNRVHPSRLNKTIYDLNIRPAIHDAIYETFLLSR